MLICKRVLICLQIKIKNWKNKYKELDFNEINQQNIIDYNYQVLSLTTKNYWIDAQHVEQRKTYWFLYDLYFADNIKVFGVSLNQ